MENLFEVDSIRTFTGKYMNVFEPTLEMICIEDIAHALSHQSRFGGHLPKFYSVAQHSVWVADFVTSQYKLPALLHDASEAYLLDIPRPIKRRLANYKEIEDRLMGLIGVKFGFIWPPTKPVKIADEFALKFEWEHLMIQDYGPSDQYCWTPERAKSEFLNAFTTYQYESTRFS